MTTDRTDHRAEAVRLAKLAEEQLPDDPYDPVESAEAYTHLAQLHVDLAAIAAHNPAGHPVTPYREALTELREAIASARECALFSATGDTVSMDRRLWDAVVYLAAGEPR